ncbi:GIN domain-containing protein [Sphingomonas parapaucimobilis]|uniref:GIN domain-containing protein n=1 Tax=Sphingomonas parapaucimobilis TaxID=28213 RepID=UPI0035C84A28
MKKMISAIALLSLAAVAAPAQESAQTTRGYDLRGFDRIDVGGCDIVTVSLGSGYAVSARGRAANIDTLRIDTIGGALRIRRKDNSCNGHDRRVAIAVTLPAIRAVRLSGAAEMNLPALEVPAFAVDTSGASVLRLSTLRSGTTSFGLSGASGVTVRSLRAERVKLDMSGASVLRADGDTGQLTIDSSGTSEVNTRALSARQVTIGASGTAHVRVGAAEQANVSASGMADVSIEGNPRCTVARSGLVRIACGR